MPTAEPFTDTLHVLHEHVLDMQRRYADSPQTRQVLIDSAFETMNSTIEELRVAEEELRQQNDALFVAHENAALWQRHYQDLFDAAPDAYLVTDLDGVIREANDAALAMLQFSKRFLRGKPLAGYVSTDDRPGFRNLLRRVRDSADVVESEILLKPRRGAAFEAAVATSVVRDSQDRPVRLRWLVRDLTGRAEAEAERYRLLVEAVKDYAIFLIDRTGRIVNWNPGAERIFGYTEAEIRGADFAALFTAEDQAADAPATELQQASGLGRIEEAGWHQRKDGSRFWGSGALTALRDKSGSLRWYAKVIQDVTARKEEEERLAGLYAQERRISATFQRALLPEIAADAFVGLTVASLYEAAWTEAQVGGDFFDVYAVDGDQVALIVGDVSGKDWPPPHTAEIKSVLRAFLRESPVPGRALSRLNTFMHENLRLSREESDRFATLAVVVIQPTTGEGSAANAGAEPPLILRADGAAEPMAVEGTLLGVAREREYESLPFRLEHGETVVLVTDGITEARRGSKFLDYEGFVRLAQQAGRQSPHEICRAILEGARAFAQGTLYDDACLLAARRE